MRRQRKTLPRISMFFAPFCALAVCEASSSSDAHETDILQLCKGAMGKGAGVCGVRGVKCRSQSMPPIGKVVGPDQTH